MPEPTKRSREEENRSETDSKKVPSRGSRDDWAMQEGPRIVQEILDDEGRNLYRDARENREWVMARYARELEIMLKERKPIV